MLYEQKQLSELYKMKHRNDQNLDKFYVKYDENILDRSLSPKIYENNTMNSYLKKVQILISLFFDHMNFMKNLKNYIVDAYDYRQNG